MLGPVQIPVKTGKFIDHALVGKLLLDGHPLSSFVERVALVAPRHPGIDLNYRLKGGCVHFLCVPLLIQTDLVRTHPVVSERPSRRSTTRLPGPPAAGATAESSDRAPWRS